MSLKDLLEACEDVRLQRLHGAESLARATTSLVGGVDCLLDLGHGDGLEGVLAVQDSVEYANNKILNTHEIGVGDGVSTKLRRVVCSVGGRCGAVPKSRN